MNKIVETEEETIKKLLDYLNAEHKRYYENYCSLLNIIITNTQNQQDRANSIYELSCELLGRLNVIEATQRSLIEYGKKK